MESLNMSLVSICLTHLTVHPFSVLVIAMQKILSYFIFPSKYELLPWPTAIEITLVMQSQNVDFADSWLMAYHIIILMKRFILSTNKT